MDGWIQIHRWLASRPARFFKNKKKNCRLASQPCIWFHPSILGIFILALVYYWMYFPYYGVYFPYYGIRYQCTYRYQLPLAVPGVSTWLGVENEMSPVGSFRLPPLDVGETALRPLANRENTPHNRENTTRNREYYP